MHHLDQAGTIALKPCHACGAGLPEHHRFCRRCGIRQSGGLMVSPGDATLPFTSADLAQARSVLFPALWSEQW